MLSVVLVRVIKLIIALLNDHSFPFFWRKLFTVVLDIATLGRGKKGNNVKVKLHGAEKLRRLGSFCQALKIQLATCFNAADVGD